MRLLLIHPQHGVHRADAGAYGWMLRYAPITMPTLAALVPRDLGAEVRVVDEMVELADPEAEADLVALTVITATAPRAFALADRFRRRGVPVVLGGVHATLRTDECLAHADAVVRGYAETSWPRLLRDFAAGRLQRRYEPDGDFDPRLVPAPERRHIRRRSYAAPNTVEMSRGCDRACDYCVSHPFHARHVTRDPAQVVEEIRALPGKMVTFLDPNVAGDREHALELFSRLVPLRRWWIGCSTLEVARDRELLEVMRRSGCKGLLIGFESLDQRALDRAGKAFLRVDSFGESVRALHAAGIMVQGTFIFGFDEDGPDVFGRTARFVVDAGIDLPQFTIYTPFPGTPAFARLEAQGRILTRDWALYNGQRCVFAPAGMTPKELEEGTARAWREAYSLGAIARRLARRPLLLKPAMLLSNLAFRVFRDRIRGEEARA